MGFFDFFSKQKTVENDGLERVILEMSVRPNMKVRQKLYSELLKGTLLLPTPSPLEASSNVMSLKEIQLVTQPGPKNEVIWISFTSKATLHHWRNQFEDAYVAIQGTSLFTLAVQNRVESILINPAGPIGGKITAMELKMLAEGKFSQDGGGDTKSPQA
jgi:hypothetical protein